MPIILPLIGLTVAGVAAAYQATKMAGAATLAEARELGEQMQARRQQFLYQVQQERVRMERAIELAQPAPAFQVITEPLTRTVAGIPIWIILAAVVGIIVLVVVLG